MAPKITQQERLSITAIHGDLTFSKRDVYLWVRLSPNHYEFLNDQERTDFVYKYNRALTNLLISEEQSLDCHLIQTSDVFNETYWANDLYDHAYPYDPTPYLGEFLGKMAAHMNLFQFRRKNVYLGVNLGFRSDFNPTKAALKIPGIDAISRLFVGEADEYLTDAELEFWQEKAKLSRLSLQSSELEAKIVHGAELAYIIRKPMFPSMVAPTLDELNLSDGQIWGKGELQTLADGEITENNRQWLEITQTIDGESYKGYRATLCFSKFPAAMQYPAREPWIHYASLLPFPVDFYSRFTIEPSRKVRKQITNKIKDMRDQASNMTSAGGEISLELEELYQLGRHLEADLGHDDSPWLFARHRIVVEAKTKEELKENCRLVIDHYKKMGITVVWSSGDQLDLLLEGMPNDKVRLGSYYQRHQLNIIGAGLPTGTGGTGNAIVYNDAGEPRNWLGPYIGFTTSRVTEPVFFSVHSALAKGESPGVVVTGASGSGKSFLAFTLTYTMVLCGTWTIYIDPKGEATQMKDLPGIREPNIIDLNEGMDGLLDPFSLAENLGEQKNFVIEVISLLLGGLEHIRPEEMAALSQGIDGVLKRPNPSLGRLVAYLKAHPKDAYARALGARLGLIQDLPFGRLCFAPADSAYEHRLRPDKDLTIITLLNLDLPDSDLPRTDYSNPNRLAVAIMYLLTSFTRKLMTATDRIHPKAIVIDEAWAITATPQGAKMIQQVVRMGRSRNTGLILVSQNAEDFLGTTVTNSVSTQIAFRTGNNTEADNVLRFFGLDETPENREEVRGLQTGECLIKDGDGRIARVKIDPWNPEMNNAFENNPEKVRKRQELNMAKV